MKLTDFYLFDALNVLKARMGIPRDVYGNISVLIEPGRLTPNELERLLSPDGLDIESLDDLKVLDDGTLAYKDSRVLLYIRDITVYQDRPIEPRFHLVNCRTLQNMRARNRFERYVVATRLDGRFKINVINSGTTTTNIVNLSVCQNCLGFLAFDGFVMQSAQQVRLKIVRNFSIAKFFERFPQSLHTYRPTENSDTAPLNIYAVGQSNISIRARQAANWCCQECGIDLSDSKDRKFLHAHHRNGQKWDNSESNLKVVCLGCHSKEASHAHMKSLPTFQEFLAIKRRLGR